MATCNPFAAWQRHCPEIQEMANDAIRADGETRRADANEITILSRALISTGIEAVRYDYPDLVFRQIASLQEGIDPGEETYEWQEWDVAGMAKVINNYGDDLPNVGASMKTNTGVIRSIGNSFEYSKQDIRRVLVARRRSAAATLLDVERIALAQEMMERKKDKIAALGDVKYSLPGVLKSANVTLISASAPATGTDRKWTGVDKTGAEIIKDIRTGISTMVNQSKGIHYPDLIVVPIEVLQALSSRPLLPSSENQTLILQEFMRSQTEMNRPIRMIAWNQCALADAAGTGQRVLFLKSTPDVLRLVEPLPFEADPPQKVNFAWKVPCESRYGSIFFKKPLGAVYMDFV
jgi:hypothetical protein